MIQLRREMEEAVDREDYERASEIRDELDGSNIRGTARQRLTRPPNSLMSLTGDVRSVKRDSDFNDLAQGSGEWLRGTGPESDIVISSRIRLARNLADFPFIRRCSDEDRISIERTVRARMESIDDWKDIHYIDIEQLSEIDRQFLVERQLISREIADADGSRAVAIDPSEQYSVMINEEDHLRIQVMHSGLDLPAGLGTESTPWTTSSKVRFCTRFIPSIGYLTACPTNVGTGLRVSVMLHLPALVITRQIEKVFRSMQRINVTVRGLYGEGSQYTGDFYQVSNQITLGHREEELAFAGR